MFFKNGEDYDVKVKRVAWNKGFDHLDSETRKRINIAFANSSPVKKGYVFKHGEKYQGKGIGYWARKHGVDWSTIKHHLIRWGNLDRVGTYESYHKNRTQYFWGKSAKEWAKHIEGNIIQGQKIPSTGSVREAIRKGETSFEKYLAKKTGQKLDK